MGGEMIKLIISLILVFLCCPVARAGKSFEVDCIKAGDKIIKLNFVGHGTLFIEFDGNVIHIDPWTELADYTLLPKADLILITHDHIDHLDEVAVSQIKTRDTLVFYSEACKEKLPDGKIMQNGDKVEVKGVRIEALPAYNIVHKRDNGKHFHPKDCGNAYLLTIYGKRILIGGDTENIPELKALKDIDIAFLPMNLPYTMTSEMVADLAKAMKPKVLYPYHFGETDTSKLVELLKDYKDIEVRIRKMQ
jgi:L-ascorbate metabolism protein UlaG (beta-lactamase superfamily)